MRVGPPCPCRMPPISTSHPTSARSAPSWPAAWCGCAAALPSRTAPPGRGPWRTSPRLPPHPTRSCKTDTEKSMTRTTRTTGTPAPTIAAIAVGHRAAAARRAEDHRHAGPEAAVARSVRRRAAPVQPPLPGKPAGLPHPGTGLWRAEAGDDRAARSAGRAAGRRQPGAAAHPPRRQADRRHPADPRMAGRRAQRDGAARRLRMGGPALQVAVRHRARDHRHALEWPGSSSGCGTSGGGHEAARPRPAAAGVMPATVRKLRCAVYTRKSTEEGLEKEFNSLDAQREACEAYIASQRAEGWVLLRDQYDDGGFSGGTLDRPALRRLLADIEAGRVDVIVVYKIDRLSRVADGLRQAGRGVRPPRRDLRLRHPGVQHHDVHGPADAEHPAELRPVRARGHRRADPRQVRGLPGPRHVDGRVGSARLRRARPQAGGRTTPRRRRCAGSSRASPRSGSGHEAGPGAARRARHHETRPPVHHRRHLQADRQPHLPGRGGPQGHVPPRRARGDRSPGAVGPRPRRPAGEPPRPRRPHAQPDAGAAPRPDLRAGRPRHVADAHPAAGQAVPLLREPGGAEGDRRRTARSGASRPARSRRR